MKNRQIFFNPSVAIAILAFSMLAHAGGISTPSGHQLRRVQIDIGDVIAKRGIIVRKQFDAYMDDLTTDNGLVVDPGNCYVDGRPITDVQVTVNRQMITEVGRGKSSNILEFLVTMDLEEDTDGTLVCDHGFIKDILKGIRIAIFEIRGAIRCSPRWRGCFGMPIRKVEFAFENQHSHAAPNRSFESREVCFRLDQPKRYFPATILYDGPERCSIGQFSLGNSSPVLVLSGRDIYSGERFQIFSNAKQKAKLKIPASAGVGRASGRVRCQSHGHLVYSY
jgi:hypothetical protein